MPELPDVSLYVKRLQERLIGEPLQRMVYYNPFVLRSVDPKPSELIDKEIQTVSRIGKRIVLGLEDELFIVIHLMIAGRFTWVSPSPETLPKPNKDLLAMWRWPTGQLSLVEHSTKKRASVHLVRGSAGLEEHRRHGLDVFSASEGEFRERLLRENRTLKRVLTNPSAFDGIGNAFSDEILFEARLSPARMTGSLCDDEIARLFRACQSTMGDWTARLATLYPDFPKPGQITAFRPDFNAHGRYGKPCPVCGSPIQHIVYADNETNYCARCQNGGKVLADRSLSRLLKDSWPTTLGE